MYSVATAKVEIAGDNVRFVSEPTAVAAMSALESLSARLDVIENALKRVLRGLSAEFETLRIAIRKCASGRNEVVHANWGVSPRYPADAIRIVEGIRYIKYTQRDFEDIVHRIIAQAGDIATFKVKCEEVRVSEARAASANQ